MQKVNSSKHRWLICAAWPYVYGVPHLGNLIGSILSADVAARFLRLIGDEVVFVSGSDMHGTPIEVEAIKRGENPKDLAERNHKIIKELF
ncbi:MAG: class I tRNA ligase family protein, partial [Thermofilum sp.]